MKDFKRRYILAALLSLLLTPQVFGKESSMAIRYLECLTAVWEQNATVKDIQALGELYAEQITYKHPGVGVEMTGRDVVLGAMENFLGTSRLPQPSDVETIMGTGVTVISFNLRLEVQSNDSWLSVERHQVIVLETDNDVITSITDYW